MITFLLENYDEIKTVKTKNTIWTKTWSSILLALFAGGLPAEKNKEICLFAVLVSYRFY